MIGLFIKDSHVGVSSLSEMDGSAQAKDTSSDNVDGRIFIGRWK